MLCYVMLRYVILYYIMLCYVIFYYIITLTVKTHQANVKSSVQMLYSGEGWSHFIVFKKKNKKKTKSNKTK